MSSKEALYLGVYRTQPGQSWTPAVWITLFVFSVCSAQLSNQNQFGCFFKSSGGMSCGQHLQGSDTSLVQHLKMKANSIRLSC